MAPSCATTHSVADRLRRADGFTLVELLLAIVVLGAAALAAGAVLANTTKYANSSEVRQNLANRAQQEVERLASLSYAKLAHPSAPPSGSASTTSPLYYYSPSAVTYRWDRTTAGASTAEALVVAAGGQAVAQQSWTDGRTSGELYAFVTWVTDGKCGSGCPSNQNYKRVTVAATVTSGGPPVAPVYVSSVIADPQALPAGKVVNGSANPLADPSITCKDPTGATVPCTQSVGSSNVNQWYLSDSPATGAYTAPTASHVTHPTVAPSGVCTVLITTGCPKPDLLSPTAPPNPSPPPALFDYSTDQSAAGYPGGRLLRRDVACSATPTGSDNSKGALWVTPALTSAANLTGAGGMTLHTQTAAGAVAGVTLCLAIYDVTTITNMVASPPLRLGVVAYSVAQWPATPTGLSFSFDFLTSGTVSVASGHRIGARLWLASSSGADIALIYDHPTYPSLLQINTQ